jgi:hypothetical protein
VLHNAYMMLRDHSIFLYVVFASPFAHSRCRQTVLNGKGLDQHDPKL